MPAAMAWILQTRWAARAPIRLFQLGIGGLLGPRILLLEHRGRTSGRSRYVCLEAVERPRPTEVLIASGFGEGSQWYRNLRADARCFVSIGARRRVPARAVFLSPGEADLALQRYQDAHPRAWETLGGAIEHATGSPVQGLPMVRLQLLR